MILSQLTSPFGYLFIKGINAKKKYDVYIPLFFTVLTIVFLYFANNLDLNLIVSKTGLISDISSFIGNLPGFYIAALAAIATFNREQIDKPLISDGTSPYIVNKIVDSNGKEHQTEETITRRMFLCFLFSFLTAESIILVIINKFASVVILSSDVFVYFSLFYIGAYFFLFWQLIISTFFGLYYLGNRIHCNS
ncbi:hypothetical protein C0W80_19455 [Photobacterium leiognathi subsp. mandapamensis]|uniref:hypothetical protein n=1 Tax=Photobacterium leiognathi TaxID=553611 RepID=UPI000D17988F|nr:hypothetical protein [Photobacterium leiognathi]PSU94366.1 hypothetical protein C0W80_19455 [Photobacterium leiognathi subsp. mandapamensis]